MSTAAAQPTSLPPAPPVPSESREREQLIRRQLGRTGLHVRLVDLASGMAVWVIGVLLLFLAAALIDHFIGLGSFGRCTALALLLGFSLWYLVMQVGPLLIRSINPAYAARTIEEATPSLKNSLINFLLLRQDRSGLKEIVYQAVERQAASDIASVPVEMAVDRSRLIYAGYVLCAVMSIFAAYKILSPKDPFQTVARVLAPWADIARPSRVQISEVQPGSTDVYHGQTVTIAATVRGAREGDTVKVLYSTTDGQAINQPVEMKLSAGNRYECVLPPDESSGPAMAGGLQQDVVYRIVAGDAESPAYRLTVVSAPTIIVDRLDYQYPAYTKKSVESLLQQGDIKALEGTKVTIHAVANQPIKSAWIEFDPAGDDGGLQTMPLSVEGREARGTMTLLLKPQSATPWHASYRVRYYNERSQKSQQPILHKIEVIRDLPPEVQILKPERLRVEVPEDGEQPLEVRGLDPDFGLSSLRIEGAAANRPPVTIELLQKEAGQPPQATVPYAFRPREHKLTAGDELRYTAVAEDNRTSPQTGQPEPNAARTKEYTLVVLPPRKNEAGQGGQQKQPDNAGAGGQQNDLKTNQQPQANRQQPNPNQQSGQDKGQSQRPDEQNRQQPMNGGEQNQTQQSGNQSPDKQPPNGEQSQKEQGDNNSKQEGNQQQPGQGQQQGQQNQPQQGQQQQGDQQQSGQQQGGQQQGGQSSGAQQGGQGGAQQQGERHGQSGGQPSGNGEQQSGQQAGSQQQGGQQQGGQKNNPQGGQSGNSSGAGEDQGKADDGRAIEEVWKDLQRHGQQGQQGQNQSQRGDGQQDTQQSGKAGGERGGEPQMGGKSGGQGQNTPSTERPEANDQNPTAKGQQQGQRKTDKSGDRLDDEKHGQNPSEQPSGGNKGGSSSGASKTSKEEKSSASKGEQRDAGAGKTGDEGAGQASEDKTGSGDGNFKNRDKNKEQKPDSNQAEKGEPSPANSSHKQSDSKGGNSGNDSGGGKQGAGQSAGQEGNDSAGSKSAADQGAGQANETGAGETGSKAGQQQKAASKTGQSGNEKGEGSGSQAGNDGASGAKAEKRSKGEEATGKKKSDSRERTPGGSAGSEPVGGADDDRPRFQNKVEETEAQEADAANLEYARKATEMVLKHLKDEEHNPDPELLDKLGWTREDLAEFLRRWDSIQRSADESPAGKRELDEALKSLGLRDPANRRRSGGRASDNQRDLRDSGNRSAPPPRYRELFDAFRKGAARSTP